MHKCQSSGNARCRSCGRLSTPEQENKPETLNSQKQESLRLPRFYPRIYHTASGVASSKDDGFLFLPISVAQAVASQDVEPKDQYSNVKLGVGRVTVVHDYICIITINRVVFQKTLRKYHFKFQI